MEFTLIEFFLSQVGTYHYVAGVDTSSSASVAAYLNTLTFSLGENQVWFGKNPLWKVSSGVYCCYNVFSHIDVRVMVQIPGSVESYIVDEQGEKQPATDQLWLEAYVSAMLRALLFTDGDNYYVSCCRRLNPLTSKENAAKFFDAFARLFELGPNAGCVSEVQGPSLVSNYLVDGILKFTELTGMHDQALEVLYKLRDELSQSESDGVDDVTCLIAKVLLMSNEEVKAIQVIHEAVLENPRNYSLLELEAQFCKDKKRLDLALDCAIRAVNAAPSEFSSWEKLVHVYTRQGDYEQALLALNSCPMFTYHDLDIHRMPAPAKVHLPLPTDGKLDEVWTVDYGSTTGTGASALVSGSGISGEEDLTDPELLKLAAASLRSTFARAYKLLTEIASHIGWDKLLKCRANVFVMEEEYKKEKKTRPSAANDSKGSKEEIVNGNEPLDKPPAALADEEKVAVVDSAIGNGTDTIKYKRLCERWLDNLFMVLYSDLRIYTVWRAEYIHYQSQQLEYHKTALEWELLGMIAYRLNHFPEAVEAFTHSLSMKFSHRVLWKILDYHLTNKINTIDVTITNNGAKNNNSTTNGNGSSTSIIGSQSISTLDTIVKLVAWNHRWYTEFSPQLMLALRQLVMSEGLVKVKNNIEAKYSPQSVVKLLDNMLQVLTDFGAEGVDS